MPRYDAASDTASPALFDAPAAPAPGKRALTDRLHRSARALASTSAPRSRWSDPTISDRSFVDSVVAAPLQRAADGHTGLDDAGLHAAAAHGVAGTGAPLPHLDAIQRAFGPHDVSGVHAHVGGAAQEASAALGAHAYATGDQVAFAAPPSLFLAAHEAAHVVQQRAGVHLSSAVGHAGDTYERHADEVATCVVRGESAAALLGPTTSGGDPAVQRNADAGRAADVITLGPSTAPASGMDLGPAGRSMPRAADSVSLPSAQPAPGGGSLISAAAAVIPQVQAVMKGIQEVKTVIDVLKGEPVRVEREGKVLSPYLKDSNKGELVRVLRYRMATLLVSDLMHIGKEVAGIDFSTWRNGMPPAGSLPTTASTPPTTAPAVPAPGAPAPAPGAAPAAPSPSQRADLLRSQLTGLTVDDLKNRAEIWLARLIEHNTRHLDKCPGPVALHKWYWNGADERGVGEAPHYDDLPPDAFTPDGYDRDRDKRTSVTFAWALDYAGVPDGTMAGIPTEVSHFVASPIEKNPVHGLGWYTGGTSEVVRREAPGDDVKVDSYGTTGSPTVAVGPGGYHMRFELHWDNADTTMTCDVGAHPSVPYPIVMNVDANGTPKT